MPERKADETRQYISASFGVARVVSVRKSDGFSEHSLATDGSSTGDSLSLTVSIQDLLAAGNEIRLDLGNAARSLRKQQPRVLGWLKRRVHPVAVRTNASDSATDAPKDYATSTALSPMHSASAGGF
ncbi:hypothetical protein MTO96_010857 [Rhipicephalus appendiculatus]